MEQSMLKLWRRFRYLIRQHRSQTELAEEMEFHREMAPQRLERNGVDKGNAAHASRRVLGNVALAGEDAPGIWIRPWVEGVWQDGAYAARIVRRSPAFAVAMILVLGLGIGATTGVFSLLDGLVIRSLPVRQPARLVVFAKPGFSYPLLAGAGLFGLLSYAVSRHTREIGLRLGLGANRATVIWTVLRESLAVATFGIAIALPAPVALGRFARALPLDAASLAGARAVMLAVAGYAGLIRPVELLAWIGHCPPNGLLL